MIIESVPEMERFRVKCARAFSRLCGIKCSRSSRARFDSFINIKFGHDPLCSSRGLSAAKIIALPRLKCGFSLIYYFLGVRVLPEKVDIP